MLCQFDKLLYPRMADASTVDYMIAVYRPLEILHDGSGHAMSQFKAVGYCLPITEKARFRLNGHWVRHPKHGLQFEVESYEEVISHTKEGIIGYITNITGPENEATVEIDFGDGRIMKYESDQLRMLDLGYASTVHKSQGAQYKSVILNLQCAHAIMLMRAIVYTAITRARLRLTIVGERKALCRAIRNTKADQRGTRLAQRIQDFIE